MRKSAFIIKGLIFLILFYQTFETCAQSFGVSPLRKCWQIEKENEVAEIVFIASDNDTHFFSVFSDGSIESVDRISGKTDWHTDLGGEILPAYTFDNDKVYLLSKDLPLKDEQNQPESSKRNLNVIALSKETGITKWQQSLPLPDTEKAYLLNVGGRLLLVTNSGQLFFLNTETGKVELKESLNTNLLSVPFAIKQNIFLGTSDNRIIGISIATGKTEFQYNFEHTPLEIFGVNQKELFVGDELGNILAINPERNETRWRVQVGAQIASITKVEKGLLVSSFDNYVYLFSDKNGKTLWRKRLSGRSFGQPIVKDNVAVFSTLNGSDTVFIELNKGKAVNRIIIPEENFFLNNPIAIDNLLLFQTYKGLIAFGTENECKQKKEGYLP